MQPDQVLEMSVTNALGQRIWSDKNPKSSITVMICLQGCIRCGYKRGRAWGGGSFWWEGIDSLFFVGAEGFEPPTFPIENRDALSLG